jgi:hypothetical protein
VTTGTGDAESAFTNFLCYNDTVQTNTKGLKGAVTAVANGSGHQVIVTGSISGTAFSTCVDPNHVIDPVAAKYQDHITAVKVASATTNCS